MILIKPVSWALICIPVFLLCQRCWARQAPLRSGAILVIGFSLIFLVGAAYRYHVHQTWLPGSFLGNQLSGKLAFADFDPKQTSHPEAAYRWLTIMAPAKQAREAVMTSMTEKYIFSLNIYDYLRFQKMPEILDQISNSEEQIGQVLNALCFSIIRQAPEDYIEDVAMNLMALWTLGEFQSQHVATIYNQKLDSVMEDLPGEIEPYRLSRQPGFLYLLIKPFLILTFIVNCGIILLGLFQLIRKRPIANQWLGVFVLACSVQCYYLLTAALQAGLVRYAIAVWPLHLMILLPTLLFLLDGILNKEDSNAT